jgi:hypothetical protein
MGKKTKIVMISMFKNESRGIRRMLESCHKHIDYYILQNNGSTDGTEKIVEEFFKDKNIPGYVYNVEEGWVGFGWNRNHVLQKCLDTNHGCDWILKMDCDEYLEIDDDFDWSILDNISIDSFNIPSFHGNTAYFRTWMWNAHRKWHFNDDTSHETIVLEGKGHDFQRVNLPIGFRLYGTNDGESYTVPTKYLTDALLLEEKLIRENTLFEDLYHFWYIGKSYFDCYSNPTLPFGVDHSKEYARRSNYYFEKYLNHVLDFDNKEVFDKWEEMSYYAGCLVGENYLFLEDINKSIDIFKKVEQLFPVRNEHLIKLAEIYNKIEDYNSMKQILDRLSDPSRTNPFPEYAWFLIDNNIYHNTGNRVKELQELYESKTNNSILNINNTNMNQITNDNVMYLQNITVNNNYKPRIIAIDDFYSDPHGLREFIINNVEFAEDKDWYKGSRSTKQYFIPGTKEKIESIMGIKIRRWEDHGMCGRFQFCTAQDPVVYHYDEQKWAGMLYLTPDAPFSTGTSLYSSKRTGARDTSHPNVDESFYNGYYDSTQFDLVDTVGNVFNRLVIFDAQCIHAASGYFGNNIRNSRLFHLFFFD